MSEVVFLLFPKDISYGEIEKNSLSQLFLISLSYLCMKLLVKLFS